MDAPARFLIGVAAAAGAVDLWLMDTGRRTISQAIRDNRVLMAAFGVCLALHVENRLGRWDPFHAAGNHGLHLVTRHRARRCSTRVDRQPILTNASLRERPVLTGSLGGGRDSQPVGSLIAPQNRRVQPSP